MEEKKKEKNKTTKMAFLCSFPAPVGDVLAFPAGWGWIQPLLPFLSGFFVDVIPVLPFQRGVLYGSSPSSGVPRVVFLWIQSIFWNSRVDFMDPILVLGFPEWFLWIHPLSCHSQGSFFIDPTPVFAFLAVPSQPSCSCQEFPSLFQRQHRAREGEKNLWKSGNGPGRVSGKAVSGWHREECK